MKTYMRDEFAMWERIKELETLNAELLAALKDITENSSPENYRPEHLRAIAKAEGRE